MHSGAPLLAKRGTMQAEKGHFRYECVKSGGGRCPLCSPVLTSMDAILRLSAQYAKTTIKATGIKADHH